MTAAMLGVERSLSGRRWRARLDDEDAALTLTRHKDIPDVLARILSARGVTADKVDTFLSPRVRDELPDPDCLKDMERAVGRLADAVEAGETIGIFGDYDVDGTTSTALLVRYLEAVGVRTETHIPDRRKEGYGPSIAALAALRGRGAGPVVTVDCGITAYEPLAQARKAGMDVVVLDHHAAEERLPAACAVVNPNRLDDESGLGTLAAVGVTFMAVVALNRELRRRGWFAARSEPDLTRWFDLVALGTVCDSVPLTGLNRALVAQGLKVMAGNANAGLAALARVAGIEGAPNARHAGFVLGPRINGRGPHRRAGARPAPPDHTRPRRGCRSRHETERLEQGAPGDRARCSRRRDARGAGDGRGQLPRGRWRRLASRRHRNRCESPGRAVQSPGGGGRPRRNDGQGLGPLRARRQPGLGDHRGPQCRPARQRRRSSDGGRPWRSRPAGWRRSPPFWTGNLRIRSGNFPTRPIWTSTARCRSVRPRATLCSSRNVSARSDRAMRNRVSRSCAPGTAWSDVTHNHVRCRMTDEGGNRLSAVAFRAAGSPLGEALLARHDNEMHLAGSLQIDRWRGEERVQLVIEDAAWVS